MTFTLCFCYLILELPNILVYSFFLIKDQNGIGHEHGMQIDSNPLKHDLEESLSTSPVLPDDSSIKGFPSMTSNIDLNDIPHNTNTFSSSDLKQGPSTGSVTQEGSSFAATDAGSQQTQ